MKSSENRQRFTDVKVAGGKEDLQSQQAAQKFEVSGNGIIGLKENV